MSSIRAKAPVTRSSRDLDEIRSQVSQHESDMSNYIARPEGHGFVHAARL